MNQEYCTEIVAEQLVRSGLPFATFFSRCLAALLASRNACVQHVANVLPGEANTEAKRQMIRRFLDQPALTQERWARVIAALLPVRPPWLLALDRTEWHLGRSPINLLVLSVVCLGCAVPLLWMVLDKPGASDTEERILLLNRFLRIFGTGADDESGGESTSGRQAIRFLTADREFIGADWIDWLQSQEIPFRIRIKACEYLEHKDGRRKRASEWFAHRSFECRRGRMWLWDLTEPLYVGGKRLHYERDWHEDEYVIVISNQAGDLLSDYRQRWKIETLFQALKGRGFDMESCRLTDPIRLSGWFGVLSLALLWCLKMGEYLDTVQPLRPKKFKKERRHSRQPQRRAESVFHRGANTLQAILMPLAGMVGPTAKELFTVAVGLLTPTGVT